jgi:hypothetical protein
MTQPSWFVATAQNNFANYLQPLMKQDELRILQIGAFTGDATDWMLYFLCGNHCVVDDVDTWEGSMEHDGIDFGEIEAIYDSRFGGQLFIGMLNKHKMTSDQFFDTLDPEVQYDFIYIDGDHRAEVVARDADNAHQHLKVGGILAFDDYQWDGGFGDGPKPAIDAFLEDLGDHYEVLCQDWQVWLKRIR